MICSKCGNKVADGMKFCTKCGSPVVQDDTDGAVQMQPAGNAADAAGEQGGNSPVAGLQKKLPVRTLAIAGGVLIVIIGILIIAIAAGSGSKKQEEKVEVVETPTEAPTEAAPTEEAVAEPTEEPVEAVVEADITVIVNDANGNVPGVAVEMLDGNGEVVRSVKTDESGKAGFTKIAAGTYTLNFSKDTYVDASEKVTVNESAAASGIQIYETMEQLTTTVTVYSKGITDGALVESVDIALFAGHNTTEGDPVVSGETNSEGEVIFADLPYGDYTIHCGSDLYFPLDKDISVSDDAGEEAFNVYLVPIPDEGEAYVVLDWNDPDLDLDLCSFNSDMREYVNITHPKNEKGSFLHADNKGDVGNEVILLRDIDSKAAQTIYVLDTTTAEADSRDSVMGKTGTHVTIYRRYEEPLKYTMDIGENALIWTVCYFQSGEVTEMDENQYSNVVTDFIWAVDVIGSK